MRKTVLAGAAFAAMLFGAVAESNAAGLVASIDVSSQTMTVSRYGQVLYRWPVSTARRGYITPRGNYRPQRTERMWYSRKYDMAPMPNSIFFRGGYAIHGTNDARNLGRPASHGCIRLSKADASALFAMVQKEGATIAIDGTPRYGNTMVASGKAKTRVAKAKGGNVVAGTRQPAGASALGYAPAQPSLIPDWPLR